MPTRASVRHLLNCSVVLALGAFAIAPASAQGDKKQQDKLEQAQRAEARVLVVAVDELAKGGEPGKALPVEWEQHHFIKAQGEKTYVPFTLAFDPGTLQAKTPMALYLRVDERGGATPPPATPPDPKKKEKGGAEPPAEFAFEDLYFFELPAAANGEPHRVSRAFAVMPGEYDVYVAVRERPAGAAAGAKPQKPDPADASLRLATLKETLTVPSFTGPQLTTSSIIVADDVEVLQAPLSNERQAEHPYTFGQMQIVPATDFTFTKKDELSIVFWIYGAAADTSTNKPDVTIEFKFHQRQDGKETYFNKTDPQALNAQTLPPQFDLAAGHQLPGSLAVPLASFPEGEYRLEIELVDKVANQTITRDINFTVASQ
jgi:hypothetical protein